MKLETTIRTLLLAILALGVSIPGSCTCFAQTDVTAKDILGNPDYQAISFGGYRKASRDDVPSIADLKEDLKILSAMGIKVLRTYNTQQYAQAANLLEAISEMKKEQPGFEMYVMLGAWIDCENAWTDKPNHEAENAENNSAEIEAAVKLAQKHPDIVKVIAVGNEAMVHWAASYFVQPKIILKWVNHLQTLKSSGKLPKELWITSSDNFASWGGGSADYHKEDLVSLLKAVDYVSLHTYPFHDTHYNSDYWKLKAEEADLTAVEKADIAVARAAQYAIGQYESTAKYIKSKGIDKPIHIGETGWATEANSLYGQSGSQAADEYKSALYYKAMRKWSNDEGVSCFFFEAFDERWKDADNEGGSENHFGLVTIDGQAKYPLWDLVDAGKFKGLTRGGQPIRKTFGGDRQALLDSLLVVPSAPKQTTGGQINAGRTLGSAVTEPTYIVFHPELKPESEKATYPSKVIRPNVWDGTCAVEADKTNSFRVGPGEGAWWGMGLEIQGDGTGEDLSKFANGKIHFEIRGTTKSSFDIGFQTGVYSAGTQTNNFTQFGSGGLQLTAEWKKYSLDISKLNRNAKLNDVTAMLYLRGTTRSDEKPIEIRHVYWTQK